jgi:signal transduction histidine kinase
MKNILKQLEEWATLFHQSKFKKAVILLTIYYTTGVFIVLTIFNLLVYILFTNSLQSKNDEQIESSFVKNTDIDENKLKEIQNNLAKILLMSDTFILMITLIVAYVSSKRTLAPLEEAYKKQSRFIADAAHELRTPLSVMKTGSEVMLRNDRTIDEYKKYIGESLEEVERLTNLSNDLLFLAHNNKNKINTADKVSLSELFNKQIEIMRSYANTKNVKIKSSITNNTSLLGIKDDLTRLFINLLKNAIDYNKNGGIVEITLNRKNNNVILSVRDNGIGIEKENLTKIFERFYKEDNSRTKNSSSTGLGLSIVKEIVYEHNGTIEVHSNIGEGTNFIVKLPCE